MQVRYAKECQITIQGGQAAPCMLSPLNIGDQLYHVPNSLHPRTVTRKSVPCSLVINMFLVITTLLTKHDSVISLLLIWNLHKHL
jgi:hypothetical protein